MRTEHSSSHGCRRPAFAAALLLAFASGATAESVSVDCRPGNPTGSPFVRLGDAVAHLNQSPALADWDYVLLQSDCTDNLTLTRSRVWIAPAWDWCPWAGCTTNGPPARISAASPSSPVITVEGPHDVTLVHLVLGGGSDGLRISNGGSVSAYGVVAEKSVGDASGGVYGNGFVVGGGSSLRLAEGGAFDNPGYGIQMAAGASAEVFGSQAWLQDKRTVISGNGRDGIRVERSPLLSWAGTTIEGNHGWGILAIGGHVTFGGCCGTGPVVRANAGGGAFLTEGSEASFWGDTRFEDNGPYGVYLDAASSAVLVSTAPDAGVVVEGHTDVGVNVTTHGHMQFVGRHAVSNNGTATRPWSAGVRVDGHSSVSFDKGRFGLPTEITGNGGPGVLLDLGSVLDAPAAVIADNLKEAVGVYHQSTAYLGRDARLGQGGRGELRCDTTSLVVTDQVAKGPACLRVEKPTGPRPARPDPLP